MWPFKRKGHELVTVSLTPQNLTCSWLQKTKNKKSKFVEIKSVICLGLIILISILILFISYIKNCGTIALGSHTAEIKFSPGYKDFKKPSAIWLLQLFPVHKINIFIIMTINKEA